MKVFEEDCFRQDVQRDGKCSPLGKTCDEHVGLFKLSWASILFKTLKTNYIVVPHLQTVGEKSKSTYKLDHVQHGPSLSTGGGGGYAPRSR